MKSKKNNSQQFIKFNELEKKIKKLFTIDMKGRYNARDIKKKLGIDNNVDSIEACLDQLLLSGFLVLVAGGQKFKFNRNVETIHLTEQKKDPVKKKKEESGSRGLCTGIFDPIRSGAAYVVCDDGRLDQDIYIPASRVLNALKGDQVQIKWHRKGNGRPEGEVLEIVKRARELYTGTLFINAQFSFVRTDDPQMPFDILIQKKSSIQAQNEDRVIVKITEWPDAYQGSHPYGIITHSLGKAGSLDIEMKSILIKYGFDISFPASVVEEANQISSYISEEEISKRRDFRQINTCTIDPDTAKDFDDALSFQILENGTWEIGVHIADVSHYVPYQSELDKNAQRSTTSVYLVDRVAAMLPETLSNGLCSLNPQEDKLTFSAVFIFDPIEMNVIDSWYGKTVIHSNRRFTYEEVQEIIEGKEDEWSVDINRLNQVAQKLKKERLKKGAFNFESQEIKFKLDAEGNPVSTFVKERKDAHMLVEDFMLLANRKVAEQIQLHWKNTQQRIPFVYRIHDAPNMEKVEDFLSFARYLGYPVKLKDESQIPKVLNKLMDESHGKKEEHVLQQMAIRTMAKAAYSTENIGHYGLAFSDYVHFTSPIRRYADVLIHRIFFDYLQKIPTKYKAEKLEELCKHISKKERHAMEAERESTKLMQAALLGKQLRATFNAVVVSIQEYGIFVEMIENHCEGLVRYESMYDLFEPAENKYFIRSSTRTIKLGEQVKVQIVKTDLELRQIDLRLIQ